MLRQIGLFPILACVLASCTWTRPTPTSETVRIASAAPIASFDPIHASDDPTTQVIQLFYEPLLRISQDGQSWPKTEALALENLPVTSQDGTEIRLQLKKGLRFHASEDLKLDERDATAMDLVATILRNGDRSLNAHRFADDVEAIEGVTEWFKKSKSLEELPAGIKIVDPETVILRLKKPEPGWWYNLSAVNFALVPKEAFRHALVKPAGSGPYLLEDSSSTALLLKKVKGPGPGKIEYLIYNNQIDEVIKMVEDKRVEVLPLTPELGTVWLNGNQLQEKFAKAGLELTLKPNSQYIGLILHPQLDPKMKEKLRLRINQHFDRAEAALTLGPLLSPCNSLYRCDAELPPIEKYKGNDVLNVRIFVNPNSGESVAQKNLAGILKAAGIEVTFVKGDWTANKGWSADLALVDVQMTTYDPMDLLSLGNASASVKQQMTSELSKAAPSASALMNLSAWAQSQSDLIALARRQSAVVTRKDTQKVTMDPQGWLDPRSLETWPQGAKRK